MGTDDATILSAENRGFECERLRGAGSVGVEFRIAEVERDRREVIRAPGTCRWVRAPMQGPGRRGGCRSLETKRCGSSGRLPLVWAVEVADLERDAL